MHYYNSLLLSIITSLLHHYYINITWLLHYYYMIVTLFLHLVLWHYYYKREIIMITWLRVMQRASLCYYITITYSYIIITQGSIITHYYLYQSPELADVAVSGCVKGMSLNVGTGVSTTAIATSTIALQLSSALRWSRIQSRWFVGIIGSKSQLQSSCKPCPLISLPQISTIGSNPGQAACLCTYKL